ncbi:hypothetical protein [Myxococcus stipitatus]|nr:hypothetical protein [Myxococcus stipitatus]
MWDEACSADLSTREEVRGAYVALAMDWRLAIDEVLGTYRSA